MKVILYIVIGLLFGLLIRVFWLQIVRGRELKQKAYEQQTADSLISAKRGTIYDINGKELAISASVETIIVNPTTVKDDEQRKKIAQFFSDNFELNYDDTLALVSKTGKASLVLMKKVEKDVTQKIRQWITDEKIKGITIIEDTKRYYPFGTLASHVLGFTGTDNQGLYGIELKYDSYLKGVPGKIVTAKDANSNELPVESERYINPEDGYNVTLTIDSTIQHIAENYLEQAIKEYQCLEGGTVIIMRPKTGEILAMSSKPDYNLNTPFITTDEEVLALWDTLTVDEKTKTRNEMWRNNAISDTYEPGSTFKLLTAAMAVEEKVVDTEGVIYTSSGKIRVGGFDIKCWRSYNPHGSQTLAQGLQNSCNPLFVYVGSKIGTPTFYKYLRSFGLMEKTGIDLPSESSSNFWKQEDVTVTDLAVMSFGQRFEITPLQLVTAVSTIANGGTLMKPMIVSKITDNNGNIVENYNPISIRQVISKETSEKILEYAESVVSIGTGKNAQIVGYKIGGKTGTGEQGVKTDNYVASFIGIAPAYNPELVILVTLHNPADKNHRQGGQLGAPTAQKVLSDTLDYLQIAKDYEAEGEKNNGIQIPDVRTKTITEAIKNLKALGFVVEIDFEGDKNTTVVADQLPVAGTKLKKGSIVKLYAKNNDVRVSVVVPNLLGMGASEAQAVLKEAGLNVIVSGEGNVIIQDPPAKTQVEEGTVVRIELGLTSGVH